MSGDLAALTEAAHRAGQDWLGRPLDYTNRCLIDVVLGTIAPLIAELEAKAWNEGHKAGRLYAHDCAIIRSAVSGEPI